jgi:hypothetical protein
MVCGSSYGTQIAQQQKQIDRAITQDDAFADLQPCVQRVPGWIASGVLGCPGYTGRNSVMANDS